MSDIGISIDEFNKRVTTFVQITPTDPDYIERSCKLDANGQPIGLTVEIVGFGRFILPLLPDEDKP